MDTIQIANVLFQGSDDEVSSITIMSVPRTKSHLKVSSRLTDVLRLVKERLSKRAKLAKAVRYRVSKKGDCYSARRGKMLKFQLDEESLTVLQDNHIQWTRDPAQFWNHSSSSRYGIPATSAQTVCRYLQAIHDNA